MIQIYKTIWIYKTIDLFIVNVTIKLYIPYKKTIYISLTKHYQKRNICLFTILMKNVKALINLACNGEEILKYDIYFFIVKQQYIYAERICKQTGDKILSRYLIQFGFL